MTQVDAEPGATIVTPNLTVKALVTFMAASQIPIAYGGVIVGHYTHESGQVVANRTIHWNADVVSGGGVGHPPDRQPERQHRPVQHHHPDNHPHADHRPRYQQLRVSGSITFQANEFSQLGDTNNSAHGLIDGNQATFYYSSTPGTVQILNYTTKDIVVNNINLLGRRQWQPPTSTSTSIMMSCPAIAFAFNVVTASAPTLVDIENQSTTGSPNIILSGFINNPIGTTKIIDSRGSIDFTGAASGRAHQHP